MLILITYLLKSELVFKEKVGMTGGITMVLFIGLNNVGRLFFSLLTKWQLHTTEYGEGSRLKHKKESRIIKNNLNLHQLKTNVGIIIFNLRTRYLQSIVVSVRDLLERKKIYTHFQYNVYSLAQNTYPFFMKKM